MQLIKAMKDRVRYKDYIDLNTKELIRLRVGNWLMTGNIIGSRFQPEREVGPLGFNTYYKLHIELDFICDRIEGVPLNEKK